MISAKSLTHIHIANCIKSTLGVNANAKEIRILDAGCGSGELILFLLRYFQEYLPDTKVDIHGFDVGDHGVQQTGFYDETVSKLNALVPSTDWKSRLTLLQSDEEWPYENSSFDFIVSNQVLEHVLDKKRFFLSIFRCLKKGGVSFHLAPLRHCIPEGHIWVPFANRIRSYDFLYAYIRFFSKMGVGKYKNANREKAVSVDEYSRRHADYMLFWTAYSTQSEVLILSNEAGLRGDFRFTWEFYQLKILQMIGRPLPSEYRTKRSAIFDFFAIRVLRYVSSVTFTLQKENTY